MVELSWETRKLHDLRGLAIVTYGGVCTCCGESDFDKLAFDHISGNGKHDRNKGYLFYQRVLDAGYPNSEYRLLCWNCNFAYGHYGYCPHNGVLERVLSEQSYRRRNLKNEMIEAYGGKCVVCGEDASEFMTVDHLNGGGKQHRATMKSHNGFYYWLRRQGWLKNEYQLLCFNCNAVKGLGGKRTWGNDGGGLKAKLVSPSDIGSCLTCGEPVYGYGYCAKHCRLTCLQCGHDWKRQSNRLTVQCPKCGSRYWGKPKIDIKSLVCIQCGHGWLSRKQDRPNVCPTCRSSYWDRDKVNTQTGGLDD